MDEIEPQALAARLSRGEPTLLLDVREPWEHELAALPNSTLIPLGELPQRVHEVAPPPGGMVVAYCHHGIRSLQATVWLRARGMTDVVSLAGGIDEWSQAVDPGIPRY